jgi:soluble lytic murein transglycosylase-like protein
MAALLSSRLSCLFVAAGILCAGQSERAAAMGWADYYAAAYRVPPELVHAIIEVESAWQSHAISTKGAAGLMQLMPATAVTFGVTNRFEVKQNIRGGVAYLAYSTGTVAWLLPRTWLVKTGSSRPACNIQTLRCSST